MKMPSRLLPTKKSPSHNSFLMYTKTLPSVDSGPQQADALSQSCRKAIVSALVGEIRAMVTTSKDYGRCLARSQQKDTTVQPIFHRTEMRGRQDRKWAETSTLKRKPRAIVPKIDARLWFQQPFVSVKLGKTPSVTIYHWPESFPQSKYLGCILKSLEKTQTFPSQTCLHCRKDDISSGSPNGWVCYPFSHRNNRWNASNYIHKNDSLCLAAATTSLVHYLTLSFLYEWCGKNW